MTFFQKKSDIEILVYKINAVIRYTYLLQKKLDLERYKTTHALITSYNHEINNPLMMAMGKLGSTYERFDEARYDHVKANHDRIAKIVKRIADLTKNDILFESYTNQSEMISLKKLNKL